MSNNANARKPFMWKKCQAPCFLRFLDAAERDPQKVLDQCQTKIVAEFNLSEQTIEGFDHDNFKQYLYKLRKKHNGEFPSVCGGLVA